MDKSGKKKSKDMITDEQLHEMIERICGHHVDVPLYGGIRLICDIEYFNLKNFLYSLCCVTEIKQEQIDTVFDLFKGFRGV